jgi:magnesium chelatase subunit I
MEEKDIQIRGFNIRIPIDIMIVFTANPEDYTNRGNLITPLKDRIDSQIITHYPKSLDDAIAITRQEAWVHRNGQKVRIPSYISEIIEQVGFEARSSEFVDQKSGVSARLTISAMENLISNVERRALVTGEKEIFPRISDLHATLPAITGKLELVLEGELEGSVKVGKALIGKAVRSIFQKYFPDPLQRKALTGSGSEDRTEYQPVIRWFESGNKIVISDDMPFKEYCTELEKIKGLRELTVKYMPDAKEDKYELATAMEFVLDALHQYSKIAKDEVESTTVYKDLVGSIFQRHEETFEEEQ